ncbi:hypothetical protein GGR50DRAFT_703795 [Xylaria sp. CBS 124048]|nr:hypothetical protein GGR50DRAFT_703795 [Xylaria sp. CBS 124048]
MPLSALRQSGQQDELAQLATKHAEHDLEPSDRETLKTATKRIATFTTIGSFVGLGLGLYASFRLRRLRLDMFNAFRAAEKPSYVVFQNGRQDKHLRTAKKPTITNHPSYLTEAIPDTTPFIRPTMIGDAAAFFFFAFGGSVLGGETGLLAGSFAASRAINKDPAGRERIEKAYRMLKVDILRKEAARLESGGTALLI